MNDNKHSNVCLNKTHELHALRIRIGSIFLRTKLGQKYINFKDHWKFKRY